MLVKLLIFISKTLKDLFFLMIIPISHLHFSPHFANLIEYLTLRFSVSAKMAKDTILPQVLLVIV